MDEQLFTFLYGPTSPAAVARQSVIVSRLIPACDLELLFIPSPRPQHAQHTFGSGSSERLFARCSRVAEEITLKRTRQQYTHGALQEAPSVVREGKRSSRFVADVYNIPRTTLIRYAARPASEVPVRLGRPSRLTREDEDEVYAWVCYRAGMNQPVALRTLRAAVGGLATARGIIFVGEGNMPSRWWLYGFIHRYGELVVCLPRRVHDLMPGRAQVNLWFGKLTVDYLLCFRSVASCFLDSVSWFC